MLGVPGEGNRAELRRAPHKLAYAQWMFLEFLLCFEYIKKEKVKETGVEDKLLPSSFNMVSSIARPANIVYVKALKRKLLVGSMRHDICLFNSRWGSMLRNSGPLRPAAQDWASRPFRLNAEKEKINMHLS